MPRQSQCCHTPQPLPCSESSRGGGGNRHWQQQSASCEAAHNLICACPQHRAPRPALLLSQVLSSLVPKVQLRPAQAGGTLPHLAHCHAASLRRHRTDAPHFDAPAGAGAANARARAAHRAAPQGLLVELLLELLLEQRCCGRLRVLLRVEAGPGGGSGCLAAPPPRHHAASHRRQGCICAAGPPKPRQLLGAERRLVGAGGWQAHHAAVHIVHHLGCRQYSRGQAAGAGSRRGWLQGQARPGHARPSTAGSRQQAAGSRQQAAGSRPQAAPPPPPPLPRTHLLAQSSTAAAGRARRCAPGLRCWRGPVHQSKPGSAPAARPCGLLCRGRRSGIAALALSRACPVHSVRLSAAAKQRAQRSGPAGELIRQD